MQSLHCGGHQLPISLTIDLWSFSWSCACLQPGGLSCIIASFSDCLFTRAKHLTVNDYIPKIHQLHNHNSSKDALKKPSHVESFPVSSYEQLSFELPSTEQTYLLCASHTKHCPSPQQGKRTWILHRRKKTPTKQKSSHLNGFSVGAIWSLYITQIMLFRMGFFNFFPTKHKGSLKLFFSHILHTGCLAGCLLISLNAATVFCLLNIWFRFVFTCCPSLE